MKKLFSSVNVSEVGLLKTLLEQEGIACATRNEQLSLVSGSVPFVECYPELWVVNDVDATRAQELISRWQNQESSQLEPWFCPRCGEKNEGQFGECWKCGFAIDEQPQ
jgi:hypothetical protein